MNTTICEVCGSSTSGRCWAHSATITLTATEAASPAALDVDRLTAIIESRMSRDLAWLDDDGKTVNRFGPDQVAYALLHLYRTGDVVSGLPPLSEAASPAAMSCRDGHDERMTMDFDGEPIRCTRCGAAPERAVSPATLDVRNPHRSGYCPICHIGIDWHPAPEDDPDAIRCPTDADLRARLTEQEERHG